MKLLDRQQLFESLGNRGLGDWAASLNGLCLTRFSEESHGSLARWISAYHDLPDVRGCKWDASGAAVRVLGPCESSRQLRESLMSFHPWRKGPFELLGTYVDSEWQSNLKWDRLARGVDFNGCRVLDVGCGNGYYGWKMLAAGANEVIGCDPTLLYILQYEVFRKYAPGPERHHILPLQDDELPDALRAFDITISMGVLYHRTSPIDHLRKLHGSLRPGGLLAVETLVIESDETEVLVPQERYAKMRNVWFIPSLKMLILWMRRTGFNDIQILDVSRTSSHEQRRTEWMCFESLAEFLDSSDSSLTVEGYPAPVRALLKATAG